MRIIVLSDTHGNLGVIDGLREELNNCDCCIHLGDCSADAEYIRTITPKDVYWVRGNCDTSSQAPLSANIRVGGKKIFCTHGHQQHVKFSMDRLVYTAMENEVDIALYGHTHRPDIFCYESILFLNPGSASLNSDFSGGTYAEIMINGTEVEPRIIKIKNK